MNIFFIIDCVPVWSCFANGIKSNRYAFGGFSQTCSRPAECSEESDNYGCDQVQCRYIIIYHIVYSYYLLHTAYNIYIWNESPSLFHRNRSLRIETESACCRVYWNDVKRTHTHIIILLLNNIVCTVCIYMVRKKSATTKTETHSSSYIVVVIFLPAHFTILFGFVVDHCKIRRRCPVNVCFGDKHYDIILLHYIILCNFVSWMFIIIMLYVQSDSPGICKWTA